MLQVDPDRFDVSHALDTLRTEGYARLGPTLAADARHALGDRLEALMRGGVRHEGLFFQADADTGRYEDLRFGLGWQGPQASYRKIEKLELDPLFRTFLANPLFERIARAWIDGPIALYRAVAFTKGAAGGTHLPWHQDGGDFWGVDRAPTLQIWTALDDAPVEAGCVEVIPRSHTRGLATPQGGVIPDALVEDDLRHGRSIMLPAAAGESLLIHNWLWHRSGVNTTGQRRSALSICYMSAATRCLRKRRAPRSFLRVFS